MYLVQRAPLSGQSLRLLATPIVCGLIETSARQAGLPIADAAKALRERSIDDPDAT